MGYRLKKTVVLVGMMGSGKTAVGTALAKILDVAFLDSDQEIEKAADRSIAEIFARDGEDFFRTKETQVISRLLETQSGVLSTGGGAYLSEENRKIISEKGVAVWLSADVDLLWARVRHRNTRPLLRTENPRKTLEMLCATREPHYQKADLTVKARPEYSIEDMAEAVVSEILTRKDVLERE